MLSLLATALLHLPAFRPPVPLVWNELEWRRPNVTTFQTQPISLREAPPWAYIEPEKLFSF